MSTISARVGRPAGEQVGRRHQDPRRAEPALERVVPAERLLQRGERAALRERLDGVDPAAVGLDREHAAAAHGDAVEKRRVQAPQTPCSQPTCVPVSPRRCRRKSVSSSRGSTASRTTRPLTVSSISITRPCSIARARRALPVRARRYRALAWMEPGGSTSDAASDPASAAASAPRRADEQPLDLAQPESAGRSPRRRRPDASTTVPLASRRSTTATIDCAKSPRAERELLERARLARRGERPDGLDDELARSRGRREVRDEELLGRDLAPAARAVDHDRSAERDEAERQLRRAVRVGDRAADRPAVPRHEVADERQRLAHQRVDARVALERGLPGRRADRTVPRSRRHRRGPRGSGRRAGSAGRGAC